MVALEEYAPNQILHKRNCKVKSLKLHDIDCNGSRYQVNVNFAVAIGTLATKSRNDDFCGSIA